MKTRHDMEIEAGGKPAAVLDRPTPAFRNLACRLRPRSLLR